MIETAGSSLVTHWSWPGGMSNTSPGLMAISVPSSMRIMAPPDSATPTWWNWQLSVLAIGFTCSDQRQPGCCTSRPTTRSPNRTLEATPFGKVSVSSGFSRLLLCGFADRVPYVFPLRSSA